MKFVIKGELEITEPTVRIRLTETRTGEIHIIGQKDSGADWLLGSFTRSGSFQPNKEGCRCVGLEIDNTFNK